ncbi:MAG: hypothetical protein K8R02_04370, partial [Anaerohalosphaeraceae bacterium]|nr:hypothetical protein [Anaerohalosphaeraceae bacterium]
PCELDPHGKVSHFDFDFAFPHDAITMPLVANIEKWANLRRTPLHPYWNGNCIGGIMWCPENFGYFGFVFSFGSLRLDSAGTCKMAGRL